MYHDTYVCNSVPWIIKKYSKIWDHSCPRNVESGVMKLICLVGKMSRAMCMKCRMASVKLDAGCFWWYRRRLLSLQGPQSGNQANKPHEPRVWRATCGDKVAYCKLNPSSWTKWVELQRRLRWTKKIHGRVVSWLHSSFYETQMSSI